MSPLFLFESEVKLILWGFYNGLLLLYDLFCDMDCFMMVYWCVMDCFIMVYCYIMDCFMMVYWYAIGYFMMVHMHICTR